MELLLRSGKIHIEADGRSVLMYYTHTLDVPGEVEPLIRTGLEFLDGIPSYLIQQMQGGGAWEATQSR